MYREHSVSALAGAVVALGLSLGGTGEAHAATYNTGNPCEVTVGGSNVIGFSMSQGGIDLQGKCKGGNDSLSEISALFPANPDFGDDAWQAANKIEVDSDNNLSSTGNTDVVNLTLSLGDANALPSWSVTVDNSALLFGRTFDIVVALKQGDAFGAFQLIFPSDDLHGLWGTFGPGPNAINDLSHATAYYRFTDERDDLGVIPLPAAGWLLLSGLGALGVMSRRRRKAA